MTLSQSAGVDIQQEGVVVSSAGYPLLSFGSWHIYTRMHFVDVCAQLDRVIDSGYGLFDIANYDVMTPRGDSISYSDIVFGRALHATGVKRDQYQVQTKIWLSRYPEVSIENQLDTLRVRTGIEYFDLINLGMFQLAENLTIDALVAEIGAMHRAGRIGGWGVTGWSAAAIREAHDIAAETGVVLPTLVQLKYGPSRRAVAEGEPFQQLFAETGIRLQSSDTLEGGVLLGNEPTRPIGTDQGNVRDQLLRTVPKFLTVAEEFGVSAATLGYAFAMSHPFIGNTLVGARGLTQVEEALSSVPLFQKHGVEIRSQLEFMWVDRGAVDVASWS